MTDNTQPGAGVGSTRTFTIPETYVGVLFDALDDAQDYRQQGDCADCEAAPNGQCEDHARDANRAQAYDRLVKLLMEPTITPQVMRSAAEINGRLKALLAEEGADREAITAIQRRLLVDVLGWDGAAFDSLAKEREQPATVTVDLTIENTYELYPDQTTYRKGLVIPVPPAEEDDAYEDWKYDHIHSQTGVGHEDGDSWYDVTVTASSRPDVLPVGTTFDFGY
jgi:hypothetical protein